MLLRGVFISYFWVHAPQTGPTLCDWIVACTVEQLLLSRPDINGFDVPDAVQRYVMPRSWLALVVCRLFTVHDDHDQALGDVSHAPGVDGGLRTRARDACVRTSGHGPHEQRIQRVVPHANRGVCIGISNGAVSVVQCYQRADCWNQKPHMSPVCWCFVRAVKLVSAPCW